MRVKAGVNLDGVSWTMWYAAAVVDYVRDRMGLGQGTITSALEGQHTAGSVHPDGLALDFRTFDVPTAKLRPLAESVAMLLGPQFSVILESDHLHVQYGQQNVRGYA